MENPIIRAEGLSKDYRMGEVTVHALVNAGFEIGAGEFVVILGPSGSGKSTLLNIIGGMDSPSGGSCFVDGMEITAFDDKRLTEYRRYGVGFVFQFYNLMANLTARENVELAVEISRDPLDIGEILRNVGLGERADHFPSQLSGGEQQRVSIARAIAKNPRLLLCDEPTGALDFQTGVTILELLKKVNREFAMTVVVITHNADIAAMGDRVIRMRSGEVIENRVNAAPADPRDIRW
ncbi:MAG: ABC transporter ATP-binding protein [Clostridiales Family XIII bacterium]|jgi:putative ABC transport system ATP-binding protein|nr:ABC transporter ATP-binding protein [Clostridiales Family XIII bacterium]